MGKDNSLSCPTASVVTSDLQILSIFAILSGPYVGSPKKAQKPEVCC